MNIDVFLASLHVASPCAVGWRAMKGDARARMCTRCDRNVFDLSAMTAIEATELVLAHRGNACGPFHLREDGRVTTAHCPPPRALDRWRSGLSRLIPTTVAGVLFTLAVMLLLFLGVITVCGEEIRRTFGTECPQYAGSSHPGYPPRPIHRSPPAAERPRKLYAICTHDGAHPGPCTELGPQSDVY